MLPFLGEFKAHSVETATSSQVFVYLLQRLAVTVYVFWRQPRAAVWVEFYGDVVLLGGGSCEGYGGVGPIAWTADIAGDTAPRGKGG